MRASAPVQRAPVIRRGKRLQALGEDFQGPFATDGIPEQHGHKVNHVVVAEAAAGKAYALTDGGKNTLLTKMLGS